MEWRNLEATRWFFKTLREQFDLDGWYTSSDPLYVQRLRGQRDVFEAIARLLNAGGEEE